MVIPQNGQGTPVSVRSGHGRPGHPVCATTAAVTPGSLFDPVLAFAKAHGGKPVFLAEWASAFYSAVPAFQVNFINEMKSYVLANPRIEAAMYWDNHGYFVCSFAVNGHSQSVSALAAMGRVIKGHIG